MNTIGIVGGGGTMGRVVGRYFRQLGYTVLICDPHHPDHIPLPYLLEGCRTIYISVFPLEAIAEVMDTIAARPNAADYTVLENGSIKETVAAAIQRLDEAGTAVCATHPLCKADQPWKNQNVIIIPYGRHGERAAAVARRLYGHAQMNIHRVDTLQEHDELMCLLQLVPHLLLRVVSNVFAQLQTDLDLLSSAATANFKLFYLSFWRVLVQKPQLSASIIAQLLNQPRGRQIYNLLVENLQTAVDQSADELTGQFRSFYDLSGINQAYADRMNLQSIVTLERLANLDKRSITIIAQTDRVGLLREILAPFDDLGINLTAIDSHMLASDDLRFDLGYDAAGADADTLAELRRRIRQMGHTIILHGPAGEERP